MKLVELFWALKQAMEFSRIAVLRQGEVWEGKKTFDTGTEKCNKFSFILEVQISMALSAQG